MLRKQAAKCLPCSTDLRFYINELHKTISFFHWVKDSNASPQLMSVKPRLMSDASAIISGRLKWPPHPSITQERWELAKIPGKLSLERCSAGVALLPVKSVTPVALPDWELGDLCREPWGNLPSHTAPQSLLKNQREHFRIKMDKKICSFGAGRVEWLTYKHTIHGPVLTEERGTEQRFAKLLEGSEHCQAPRKAVCLR